MTALDRILQRAKPKPQPVARVAREQTTVERLLDLTRAESAVTSTYTRADEIAEDIVLAKLARRTAWCDDPWEAAMLTFGGRP